MADTLYMGMPIDDISMENAMVLAPDPAIQIRKAMMKGVPGYEVVMPAAHADHGVWFQTVYEVRAFLLGVGTSELFKEPF